MFKKIIVASMKIIFGLIILSFIVLGGARIYTLWFARSRVFSADKVQPQPVAIVFGAGLSRDGSPTPVLRDRVATAVDLYLKGKVQILLMSGDNRFVDYNEPGAMKSYAIQLGVPENAIVLDYAGRRTYDTCYRAKTIFGVTDAILVTQNFHLSRALYLCNRLGISAIGVPADRRTYDRRSTFFWTLREIPATFVAVW